MCEHRLGIAALAFDGAAQLTKRLAGAPSHVRQHFLRDTVARIAIDQAAIIARGGDAALPRELVEPVLAQSAELLERRWPPALLESGFGAPRRVRDELLAPLLWTRRSTEDAAWRCFHAAADLVLHGRSIVELGAQQVATVEKGIALLESLLPELGASALAHAVTIIVTEHPTDTPHSGFKQGTFSTIPGTLFLSPRAISDPWEAAEAVLHEAMHLKFIDLEYTHSMRPNAPATTITPPWHRLAPHPPAWPVTRAMTAMHVYVALALFFSAAEAADPELLRPFGAAPPARRKRQALDRAHYLLCQLEARHAAIGAAGQRFLGWIRPLLAALDPEPPAPGSELHLVLDLYERELEEVSASIAHFRERKAPAAVGASRQDWKEVLEHLVQSETAQSRAILSQLGLPFAPSAGASDEVAEIAPLSSLRRGVAAALRSVHPTRALEPAGAQGSMEALVREMVQASGQQIHELLGSLG